MSVKSPLSVSHMKAADGGTIKKPIMVLPGGKSQERRASRFSFFCIYDNPDGDPRARGSLVMFFFFSAY